MFCVASTIKSSRLLTSTALLLFPVPCISRPELELPWNVCSLRSLRHSTFSPTTRWAALRSLKCSSCCSGSYSAPMAFSWASFKPRRPSASQASVRTFTKLGKRDAYSGVFFGAR